jgi:predicted HTH domain antitoxin
MDATVTLELRISQEIYVALQSAGLSRDEIEKRATREIALQLYSEGRLSFGKAALMAGLAPAAFWMLLAERGLTVFQYTIEDYETDQPAIRRIMDTP